VHLSPLSAKKNNCFIHQHEYDYKNIHYHPSWSGLPILILIVYVKQIILLKIKQL